MYSLSYFNSILGCIKLGYFQRNLALEINVPTFQHILFSSPLLYFKEAGKINHPCLCSGQASFSQFIGRRINSLGSLSFLI